MNTKKLNPADKVEQWPIEKLVPYAKNSRTHSEEQVAQIASSIKEWGFTTAVLVDESGSIIAGHGRVMAARKLGMASLPVMVAKDWSDAQKRAYVIADNKLALNAGWDNDLLALELAELGDLGFDLELTGFSDEEIKALMPVEIEEGLTDEDAVPDVPVEPVTRLGDVWVLGKHRLMCGDSTSIEQAEKLMDGVKADMVFTDPPYNVAYEGRGEKNKLGPIKNDDMSDESFEQFCRDVFATYHAVMKPLACIYVCHPDSQTGPKLAFERTFGELFKKASTLIWVKQSAGMGWQDYRAQHEPILYGWKEGGSGKHFYCGDRSKTTVWQIGRDAQASYVHPTQKPVALPEEAIKNSSKGEDVVLDLFGGSGSTLIACEKTGRVNRIMELDPKYCDVIVQRWQDFTGQIAILEADGRTFDEVKNGNEKAQN
jgi:DNA modification methylase